MIAKQIIHREFKYYDGTNSPLCIDCRQCDCFENEYAYVYGYKYITKSIEYYCHSHLSALKCHNAEILRKENKDRKLKKLPKCNNIDYLIPDKIIYSEKKCGEKLCEEVENLHELNIYKISITCNDCANDKKEKYYYKLLCSEKYLCPSCNIKCPIIFDNFDKSVMCNKPYSTYGKIRPPIICKEITEFKELNIIKPKAIRKNKNKNKNKEDLDIEENIVTSL